MPPLRLDGTNRPAARGEEALVPFPCDRARVPQATHLRSIWLTLDLTALRDLGLYDRYATHLSPSLRREVESVVAGAWVPIQLFGAHFAAIDALALNAAEQAAIGSAVAHGVHDASVAITARLIREAGATPWTVLGQAPRLLARFFQGGGAIAVYKLGPKEARVELAGYPLAGSTYVRNAMRGAVQTLVGLFCQRIFVRDVPALFSASTLGYRVQWV